MGAEVVFVSLLGGDAAGRQLRGALRSGGVDDAWMVEDQAISSLHKLRVIAHGQYVVRFDEGDIAPASERSRSLLLRRIAEAHRLCDLVVVSDDRHGVVGDDIVCHLRLLRDSHPRILVVDSKEIARFRQSRATMVTPNLAEARRAVDVVDAVDAIGDALTSDARGVGARLRALLDADHIAVTMAEDGVLLTGPNGEQEHLTCHPVQRAGDVGAGDSFAPRWRWRWPPGAPTAQPRGSASPRPGSP